MEELIPTLQEEGEERIDTLAEQTIIAGVQTINGKAGDLDLKTINNTDLLTTGNLSLATPTDLSTAVSTHNTSATAHTDIRQAITSEATARENADTALNNAKQDKLVAGTNIQIAADGKTISATDTTYSAGSGLNLTGTTFSVDTDTIATQDDIYTLQTTKQDNLTTTQLSAVNSGIDSTKVAQIATNEGDIATINGKIPTQASTSNQLADKNFVNSSVQTATANYRGSWDDWASVPTQASDYPEDYAGSHTPTVNDYMVVQDASDYTEETLEGTWRFKYTGEWDTNGKAGWLPEYQVNETPLTAAQIAAINSGITDTLVAQISTNQSDISNLSTNKLDKTTTFWGQTAQNGAVQGTLTLTESGQNATIATSGHNTTDAGIKMGNSKNYVEAGVTEITLSSTTGGIKLKPKSGSSVDVMSSKITNLATPTANTDASTKKYVDDGLATKQNTLTAGANITITGDEISATDTTYSAGTNVQITGTTISATDTTYSAGTGLTLTGTTFSVDDPAPSGFFTGNAVTESECTAITLPNALGTTIKNVELEGDTSQTTYTGKNLFNSNNLTKATQATTSLTILSNGWEMVTSSTGYGVTIQLNNLTPSTTYTISGNLQVVSGTPSASIRAFKGTAQTAQYFDYAISSGSWSKSFTLDSETTSANIWFYNGRPAEADTKWLDVQFEAGSATAYEPYVGGIPSPNPDYPQDVNVVTGRQTVKVCGKNLFDGILELGYINGTTGLDAISNNHIRGKDYIPVKELTNYKFSTNNANITSVLVYEYKADKSYNLTTNKGIDLSSYLTTNADTAYIRFRPAYQTTDTSIKFQVEEGTVATIYEPYVGQSYEIDLGKNLWDEETPYKTGYAIDASGVEGANANFNIYGNIQVPANTTYTLSAKGGSTDTIIRMHAYNLAGVWQEQIFYTTLTANTTITYTFTTPNYPCILRWNCYKNATNRQLELGSQATTYSAYFTPIELCKIGTYQDYIYKANGNWYKHSEVGKVVLTGAVIENWQKASTTGRDVYYTDTISDYSRTDNIPISDHFVGIVNVAGASAGALTNNHIAFGSASLGTQNRFYVRYDGMWATTSDFNTWLSTNTPTVYYALDTATDTQITNADLITQLEALASAQLATGINYINSSGVRPNLDAILTIEAFNNNWNGLSQALLGA